MQGHVDDTVKLARMKSSLASNRGNNCARLQRRGGWPHYTIRISFPLHAREVIELRLAHRIL